MSHAEGMKQFFVATYTKADGKVAGLYGYREGDADFRVQITQAKATGVKAVVLPGREGRRPRHRRSTGKDQEPEAPRLHTEHGPQDP